MQTINDFLKEKTKERSVTFWGETTTYKPYLCDTIIGDGMQLVYLQPIDSRPYLWLIR